MKTLRDRVPSIGRIALYFAAATCVMMAETPVKLGVRAEKRVIHTGDRARLHVTLLDADNLPRAAAKNMEVQIIARFPSNETKNLTKITIPAGQTDQTVDLAPFDATGVVYIWAKHPELRVGGLFLSVRPPGGSQHGRLTMALPTPPASPPSHVTGAASPAAAPRIAQPEAIAAREILTNSRYQLALRFSPQRGFLANGKDPATVLAFVETPDGEPNTEDVRVNLFDSSGTLAPTPLVVPANTGVGEAKLTSDTVGSVTVEYRGATPPTQIEGDRTLDIHFEPPIVALELKPSPEQISFVDSCDLLVQLVDETGKPIATQAPRTVSLTLTSGKGVIESKDITIAAGSADGRTTFTPTWWGSMKLAASTPNLLTHEAVVAVGPPWGLLITSLLGGLAGGFLHFLRYRRSKKLRIPIGAFTGMILYWAALLFTLTTLARVALLNPISAFLLAVLGGWLGLEVFEPILKKLGLSKEKKAKA